MGGKKKPRKREKIKNIVDDNWSYAEKKRTIWYAFQSWDGKSSEKQQEKGRYTKHLLDNTNQFNVFSNSILKFAKTVCSLCNL